MNLSIKYLCAFKWVDVMSFKWVLAKGDAMAGAGDSSFFASAAGRALLLAAFASLRDLLHRKPKEALKIL